MSSPSKDITIEQDEMPELGTIPLVSESATWNSSRTSIRFITNDQDKSLNKNADGVIDDVDPMDVEEELDPNMTLKEFVEIYLTGPRSMQNSINNLMRELVDAKKSFNQARVELQNSKSDISSIHSQFFESRRTYDTIIKELNDSKILSEQLKSEVKQLKIDQGEKLNEINFKVDQLSRIILQQQQGQQHQNNSQMHFASPVQYYHPPPQHAFAMAIQQQQQPIQPPPLPQHAQRQLPPGQSASQYPIPDAPIEAVSMVKTEHIDHHLLPPPSQLSSSIQQQHQPLQFMAHELPPPNPATPKIKVGSSSEMILDSSTFSSPIIPQLDIQEPSTRVADVTSRTFRYSLLKQITSIRQIWQEYAYGLNGQPSIKSLQIKYKTKWRYPEDASTFKRRKRIYKAIEIAMLNGMSEEEAITELENHRLDKEGNYRRSLQWLCDNIPEKFRGA